MLVKEVRELSKDEMFRKVEDIKEEIFNLRFQHSTGELENPNRIKQLKRDAARIKTILREDELTKLRKVL